LATGVPSKRKRIHQPYELSYELKMPESEVLSLHPGEPENVVDFNEGRLYRGENLDILLRLLQDKELSGGVRCVYIDPPYSTSMDFVDRNVEHAYEDNLSGAAYLEFLRRRLIVLKKLMASDGSIFVHLDQNMVFEIKIIMDEVFGRDNFRNFITRKKCNTKNYTRKTLGNVSDHILFYTKSEDFVWHRPFDPWSPERMQEEYPCIDKKSGRRYKRVPLHAPGVRRGATGKHWRGIAPPPGKHWQYVPERLDELDKAGEIHWSLNGNPRRKVFFDPGKGIPAQDIWTAFKDAHNQNIRITGYPTEKNFEMLLRIVSCCTNKGDWVLDCFSGSGTTLEAARALGRRFIGIDNSPAAIDATVRRLKHGRQPMGDFVGTRKPSGDRTLEPSLFDMSNGK